MSLTLAGREIHHIHLLKIDGLIGVQEQPIHTFRVVFPKDWVLTTHFVGFVSLNELT